MTILHCFSWLVLVVVVVVCSERGPTFMSLRLTIRVWFFLIFCCVSKYMIRSLSSSYFLTLLKGILAVQMYLTFLNQKIERDLLTNWVSWINNDLFSSSFLLSWRISSSAAAAVAESEINFIFSSSSLDCSWLQNWPEKKNSFAIRYLKDASLIPTRSVFGLIQQDWKLTSCLLLQLLNSSCTLNWKSKHEVFFKQHSSVAALFREPWSLISQSLNEQFDYKEKNLIKRIWSSISPLRRSLMEAYLPVELAYDLERNGIYSLDGIPPAYFDK